MSIFSKVAKTLQFIFNERADILAKETGFIIRQRKITGSNFIKTFLFGWLQNHCPSMEGLVRSALNHGLHITAQGLDKRFNESAATFIKSVLDEAVGQVVKATTAVDVKILNRFTSVYVSDCSTVTLPDALHTLWRGTGGRENTSRAALKIDTCIELKSGQLQYGLLPGRHCDNHTPLAEAVYEPGCLRLQDLGYFNLDRMKRQAEQGEYWISRYQTNTRLFDEQGAEHDLPNLLMNLKKRDVQCHELAVELGVEARLKARLLVWRLPTEAADRARARVKEKAAKKGRTATAASLALCDWKILLTNAPIELLSFSECFLLYGVRWQIELLFKLWKSHGKLGHSNSKNKWRILCELYCKLLAVMVQHWIFLTGLWPIPERSLVKGGQMIREQSARLATCFNNLRALTQLLRELAKRFQVGCRQNTRKKRPNTWRQLEEGYEYSVS